MKKLLQVLALLLVALPNAAADAEDTTDESAAVQEVIDAYVAAFNARDVEQLVKHWSPEGVYTSRATGEKVMGREAVAKKLAAMFSEEKLPKLTFSTESIEFISPNVALERGVAMVARAKGKAVEDVAVSRYRVVYVKREGAWLIDRVTEDETEVAVDNSHHENLKALEWMIGEWFDEGDGFTIEIVCKWTKNKNFISRTYVVSNEQKVESSGLQMISWDPQSNQIRSWLFDSDGGVVTGEWAKRDDRWIVQSVTTLADGGSGSFTCIFCPLDAGTYAWQKINRVIDGQLLPSVEEIRMQRK